MDAAIGKALLYGFRSAKKEGNDQYEGFCIDIIIELSKIYKFNYEFKLQEDKDYGTSNTTDEDGNKIWSYVLVSYFTIKLNNDTSYSIYFSAFFLFSAE